VRTYNQKLRAKKDDATIRSSALITRLPQLDGLKYKLPTLPVQPRRDDAGTEHAVTVRAPVFLCLAQNLGEMNA